MSELDNLIKRLGGHALCSPKYNGQEIVSIACRVEFEPFGKATEAWSFVWALTIHIIPYHWHSTTGWRKGVVNSPMRFQADTLDRSIKMAHEFLDWWLEATDEME